MVYRAITVLAICSLMVSAMAQGNQKHNGKYIAKPAFFSTPGPAAALPFVAGFIRSIRRKRA